LTPAKQLLRANLKKRVLGLAVVERTRCKQACQTVQPANKPADKLKTAVFFLEKNTVGMANKPAHKLKRTKHESTKKSM
jgi:hypothetical protein